MLKKHINNVRSQQKLKQRPFQKLEQKKEQQFISSRPKINPVRKRRGLKPNQRFLKKATNYIHPCPKTPRLSIGVKVIGIGGAGCNTISRLKLDPKKGIETFSLNTDAQSLTRVSSSKKILIGEKITGGLGTGMNWKLGQQAAEESKEILKEILKGTSAVFLTAGLGGGTGTPVISFLGKLAKTLDILTIAVVTLPFSFEGAARKKLANWGLKNLQKNVDAYLAIPNDRILKIINKNTLLEEAFLKVDKILKEALEGIFEILFSTGIITLDFADLEEILKNSGRVLFSQGRAKGEQRATAAISQALQSSLIDFSPKKIKGVLFTISGQNISLTEVNLIANFIKRITNKSVKILFAVLENKNLEKGELKINLIASGIE